MKTIVTKLRFALLLGFLATSAVMWGQVNTAGKLSIATQMFLDEMKGELNYDNGNDLRLNSPGSPRMLNSIERPYVLPDTVDGVACIPAFVKIKGDDVLAALRELGVIVETVFDDGVLTTLIPVDEILPLSAVDGVERIEISTVMQLATDQARKTTNVDDVLGFSADAVTAGLPNGYDGQGVIVGVIDRGIDYNHIAFKDKNGECRIKRAYVYNGSQIIEYDGTGDLPNDNITNTDHGTHTSSIAGGSSVIVDGDSVIVTDDHALATYGGMAPGSDLYLCGINGMGATRIANAFRKICDYADEQGKPVVISNSYGESVYNRDGSGMQAQILSQLFGEEHPDRICLFATGNNAGHSGSAPGGIYVSGPASEQAPLGTIVCSSTEAIQAGWQYYRGEFFADAFTRATDATGIGVKINVLEIASGLVVDSCIYTTADGNKTVSLGDYFTGYNGATPSSDRAQVRIYFDYSTANNRKQALLCAPYGLISPDYTLAIEVYPIGGSSDIIDMWSCGNYTFFDNHLETPGHVWTLGSDDMSVFANACYPQVISVGSYVTRTRSGSNALGDISDYSNYALEGMGPLGTMHPWISAPGEDIIAAFNHNVNRGYWGDVIINDPENLYGLMSGTSMSTPMAAGIVALWMQAASECGQQLTLSQVKTIMRETAIRDYWVTDGPHSTHFGNGKIDALAGVEYILREFAPHGYERGDVNHDGELAIDDVTILINMLLVGENQYCDVCADVDEDGEIAIADVTQLINWLLFGKD